jgi:hypothetical protein
MFHRTNMGGCKVCGLTASVGNWDQHARGKRHVAATARAAAAAASAGGDASAPPAAKKAKPTPPPAAPAPAPRPPSPPRMTQTDAMSEYCLSKKELDGAALDCRAVANPHSRRGPPMRLYVVADVAALALSKYGDAAGLAAHKAKNAAKAAKAAATRAHNDGWRVGANPFSWTPATHASFTPQFRAAVRTFLLCAHRLRLFGGAHSGATLCARVVTLMVVAVPPRPNQLAKKERPRRAPRYSHYDRYDHYYEYGSDGGDGDDWDLY